MRSWGKLMSEVGARAASNTPIVRSLSDMEAKPVSNSSPEMKPPAGHLHMSRGRSLPRLFDFARKNNCRTLHNISEAWTEKKNTRMLKLRALLVTPDYTASTPCMIKYEAGPLRCMFKVYNHRKERIFKADRKDLRFFHNEELLEICFNERSGHTPCPWWVLRFYTELDYYALQNELLMDASF